MGKNNRYFTIGIMIITVIAAVFFFNMWTDRTETIYVHKMAKDDLFEEIEKRAKQYDEPAEDAYIDRVWKKTPGRDGRKVNVEKSYEKMKQVKQFDETLLVYDTIKPEVHLKDLPPAPIYRGHPKKK